MKFKFSLVFFLIIIFLILLPNSSSKTIATGPCDYVSGRINATDLITALADSEGFGTKSGACVINTNDAVFKIDNIPKYADLKSKYYTQSKALKVTVTSTSLPAVIADQTVYLVIGDLTVSGAVPGGTAVVFVDGQLNINSDFTYGSDTTGIVFIVQGNVNIDQTVTKIDAVIISGGTICTAYNSGSCLNGTVTTAPLVINGSLISLDATYPIQFKRYLSDNSKAAEVVKHQVKYLVILRNILSDTVQKWTEVLPAPQP